VLEKTKLIGNFEFCEEKVETKKEVNEEEGSFGPTVQTKGSNEASTMAEYFHRYRRSKSL
jgi:hypothetical protein